MKILFKILRCVFFSVLMCLISLIEISLAFTPVPLTFQLFVCLISGGVSGAAPGAASMFIYVLVKTFGLPVFSGMNAGAEYVIGPTGGFIIGFIPCAFFAGKLSRYLYRPFGTPFIKFAGIFSGFSIATILLYLIGALFFSIKEECEIIRAVALSVLPFIWIDLFKITAAAAVVNRALQIAEEHQSIRL